MAEMKTDLTLPELARELKAGTVRRVYVLTGDERYLIEQVLAKLVDALVNPASKDFDLAVFDTWRLLEAVLAAVSTPPLFSTKKVVIVKQSDLFANVDRPVEPDLARLPDSVCLILLEAKVLKSGQAKKHREALAQAGGAILPLTRQSSGDLLTWIARLTAASKLRISRQAALHVIERMEQDMSDIAAAVERLMLYAQYEGRGEIDEAMVDHLLPAPLSVRIFDLMDAVSQRQAGRAFQIVDELLVQREPVTKITFMILRQIRQLMVAKDVGDQQIARDLLNVQPFVARKLHAQAARFAGPELERIHSRGFAYDVAIRRGSLDDKTALFLLVAYACEAA